MDFICKACGLELTTEDVARQTLAVPFCIRAVEAGVVSHAGPFEHKPQTQTRPENVPTRNAVDV